MSVRRYTAEEIAEFIAASGSFEDLNEAEIVAEIAAWDYHMADGGYPVGQDDQGAVETIAAIRKLAEQPGLSASDGIEAIIGALDRYADAGGR